MRAKLGLQYRRSGRQRGKALPLISWNIAGRGIGDTEGTEEEELRDRPLQDSLLLLLNGGTLGHSVDHEVSRETGGGEAFTDQVTSGRNEPFSIWFLTTVRMKRIGSRQAWMLDHAAMTTASPIEHPKRVKRREKPHRCYGS
jgi:hypothetical protein